MEYVDETGFERLLFHIQLLVNSGLFNLSWIPTRILNKNLSNVNIEILPGVLVANQSCVSSVCVTFTAEIIGSRFTVVVLYLMAGISAHTVSCVLIAAPYFVRV